MYFDDLKLGMTVDIAPALIEREKMLTFAHTYDPIPLHAHRSGYPLRLPGACPQKDLYWPPYCAMIIVRPSDSY